MQPVSLRTYKGLSIDIGMTRGGAFGWQAGRPKSKGGPPFACIEHKQRKGGECADCLTGIWPCCRDVLLSGDVNMRVDGACPWQAKRLKLKGRPPFAYDVLSIDIGITPSSATPGAASLAVPVKPIFRFVVTFEIVHICG